MIKTLFCDLDYTLLTDDKELLVDNILAINELRKSGCDFVICTGRMPFLIQNIVSILRLGTKDLCICANGGVICDAKGRKLASYPIEAAMTQRLTKLAKEERLGLFASSLSEIKCINKEVIESTKVEGHVALQELSYQEINRFIEQDIYKLSLVSPDYAYLMKLCASFEKEETISAAFSSNSTIEIVNGNRSKARAVKDIMKMKNINENEIAVIGDNMNDISMFELTNNCYCPKNATDEIKSMSSYISIKTNNEAAVADIVWNIILKKGD
ncbi:MAG: HAD family hydrolase [Erysipelotrichaceae bacterium]